MGVKYNGLQNLLQQNNDANRIYTSLPDYIKETISGRSDSICSVKDLQMYAENLLSGDE